MQLCHDSAVLRSTSVCLVPRTEPSSPSSKEEAKKERRFPSAEPLSGPLNCERPFLLVSHGCCIKTDGRLPLMCGRGRLFLSLGLSQMTVADSPVFEITNLEEFNTALASAKVVVLDFYSTQCPPCTVVLPLYKSLAEKYPNAKFYKVNGLSDEGYKVQQSIDVVWWPTFVIFVDGHEVWRVKIPNPPQEYPTKELEEELKKVYV